MKRAAVTGAWVTTIHHQTVAASSTVGASASTGRWRTRVTLSLLRTALSAFIRAAVPVRPDPPGISTFRTVLIGAAIATAYVAAAEVGFRAAFVAEQVTTVWAPTGIAVASLLIWGSRLWPAIWLGAFAVNATTSAPLWTAFIVASGNTLEAVVATRMLRRIPLFDFGFRRVADALTFVGIAAIACTT